MAATTTELNAGLNADPEHGPADADRRQSSSEAIDISERLSKRVRFFLGISYSFFLAWAFGRHPEYLFLLYMVSAFVFFPIHWLAWCRRGQAGYLLEFCWFVNIVGNVVLLEYLLKGILHITFSDGTKQFLFSCAWVGATGPLLIAVMLLGNKAQFEDLPNMVSTFIHLTPSLTMYCLRWKSDIMEKSWGLDLEYVDKIQVGQLYRSALVMYIIWSVPYCIILMASSYSWVAPRDNTFLSTLRGLRKSPKWQNLLVQRLGCPGSDSHHVPETRKAAALYMCAHFLGTAVVTFPIGVLCFESITCHRILQVAAAMSIIWRSASYYDYKTTPRTIPRPPEDVQDERPPSLVTGSSKTSPRREQGSQTNLLGTDAASWLRAEAEDVAPDGGEGRD